MMKTTLVNNKSSTKIIGIAVIAAIFILMDQSGIVALVSLGLVFGFYIGSYLRS